MQAKHTIVILFDIRLTNGALAVSPLATTEGAPMQMTGRASENEECGATAMTGASLHEACRPFTFTQ